MDKIKIKKKKQKEETQNLVNCCVKWMFDNKHACDCILSSKCFAKGKMNEESFLVMVGATPTWVNLGSNGKADTRIS